MTDGFDWQSSWSVLSKNIAEGGSQLLSRAQSAVQDIQQDPQYMQFFAGAEKEGGERSVYSGVHSLKSQWKKVAPQLKQLGEKMHEATNELTLAGMRVLQEARRPDSRSYLPWDDVTTLYQSAMSISGHQPGFVSAELQRRILRLSANPDFLFVLEAPADFCLQELHWQQAKALIAADNTLRKLRYDCVPRKMSEDHFWKQYMWRVEAEIAQLEVEIISGQLPVPVPPPPPAEEGKVKRSVLTQNRFHKRQT